MSPEWLKTRRTQKRAEEVRGLLPWYASGNLSATERQTVETWLRHDAELAAELCVPGGAETVGELDAALAGPDVGILEVCANWLAVVDSQQAAHQWAPGVVPTPRA